MVPIESWKEFFQSGAGTSKIRPDRTLLLVRNIHRVLRDALTRPEVGDVGGLVEKRFEQIARLWARKIPQKQRYGTLMLTVLTTHKLACLCCQCYASLYML